MLRIEISSGGLGTPVLDFQADLASYISDAESVIASFKTVRNSTYSLNGGVGSLESALTGIEARIQTEETKKLEAEHIQTKANDFLQLAERVVRQVASTVSKNKEEFYNVSPWLRPAPSVTEEVPWYEKAWNWLCEKGEAIADGLAQAWDWFKDTMSKGWNALVDFYNEHKKIIDTILIVVGAVAAIVAVVASGGLALVPLLTTLGVPAALSMTISTVVAVVAVVSTVGSSVMNIVDTWCEIDNPVFNAFQRGLNITSAVSNLVYSIGGIYNTLKGYRITSFDGKSVIQNDGAFDPMQVDSMGRTNLERMSRKPPLAPIGTDGKSVELHHLLQTEDGGLIELTRTAHRGKESYSFWHNTESTFKSVVDHGKEWREFTQSYWSWRSSNSTVVKDLITGITSVYTGVNSEIELLLETVKPVF